VATQVQIELTVDEKGAVQGVRNFDTAVKSSTGSVAQLNAQLNQASAKAATGTDAFNARLKAAMASYEEQSKRGGKVQEYLGQQFDKFSAGNPAVVAFEKAAEAARNYVPAAKAAQTATEGMSHTMEGHFQTSFDRVRLLRTELGVRVPRAMESIIARNSMLMAGINQLGGLLVTAGAAMIAFQFGKELYDAYEKYISLDAAAEQYRKTLERTKEGDYWRSDSIETTTLRINDANAAAQGFLNTAQAMHSGLFADIAHGMTGGGGFSGAVQAAAQDIFGARMMADAGYKQKGNVDKLTPLQLRQQHELAVQQIELNHALDGELKGQSKINAALAKHKELAAEMRSYETKRDSALGNPVGADAGARKEHLSNLTAQREAMAEATTEARSQHEETLRLQAEAREANLQGEALYMDQRNEMLRQLREKLKETELSPIEYRKQVAAVEEKYDNERKRRMENYQREVEQAQGETALKSFHGIGHMQAQNDLNISNIRALDKPDWVKDQLVANARRSLSADMLNQEREFTEQVDEMADEQATHALRGFARIRGEAQKMIATKRRAFEKEYSQVDRSTPEGEQTYQSGLANFNREKRLITGGAQVDTRELAQRNAEETAQIEEQAHARSMQAERNQTAAIEAEYEQRAEKYYEQLKNQEISEDDYNRRVRAAAEERDAQMVAAARQAREKMAGQFSRFFRSPMEALKEFGDRAAGEAAATMVQRIGGRFGAPAMTQSVGGPFGALWAKMGHLPGVPEFGQRHNEIAPQHGLITLGTAQIRIGTASLSIGGSSSATPMALDAGWSGSSMPSNASGGTSDGGSSGAVQIAPGISASPAVASTMMRSTPMPSPAGNNSVLANAHQAFSLGRSGLQLFRSFHKPGEENSLDVMHDPLSGTLNSDGTFSSSSSKSGGMLTGGGFGANAAGAAGGVLGLYGAYQSSGGFGGAAQGAMSGMELGMAVGGPVGAAVGAAAGAIFGAIGFGGKEKARVYDLKQVRPRLGNDMDSYQQGGMDYTSAYMDMESLIKEADMATHAMGPAGGRYYNDTIKPEIRQAEGKLNAEQRAGRSKYTATAAQFDQGGWADDFGAMSTGATTGWAHMRRGEFVVHEQPAAAHAGALEAIRAGASHADMARYYGADPESVARGYRAAMLGAGGRSQSGGDRTLNMNVHAIDARSVAQFFDKYKHHIRAAVNASYAENSGGSDA